MNVTSIGVHAAKWVRAPASISTPTPTPPPTQQSPAAPPGRSDSGVPALVSAATQHALLMATQAIDSAQNEEHIPPAQQARAAILENPELEDRPFGSIVSGFAHGETPPLEAPTGSPSDTPAADTENEGSTVDPAVETDPSITTVNGGDQAEIGISPPPVDPDALIAEMFSEPM